MKMRLIVTSQEDIAGTNIYEDLAENFGFKREGDFEGKPIYKREDVWLISTERNQTRASHLDEFFSPEYYVFASRHRSESKEKTLTVHTTGNLTSEALVGGRPEELAYCNPSAMKVALLELQKAKEELKLDYKVSMEATHHGPTELNRPVLFVEVGSTEEEWRDKKAVRAVARAALKAAQNKRKFSNAIGIGGNHYAPIHTKVMLESKIAIGHIIPTYAIMDINERTFVQAIEKTRAKFGFLDWKGMRREHRERIMELAERMNFQLKRGRDILEHPKLPEYEIDKEIFKEAEKIGRKRIESIISKYGGIVQRDRDGKLRNRFSAKTDIRGEVIKACLEVLKEKYHVEVKGSSLILKEEKFDPAKARALGIKPGPIFGELAKGKPVEVGGRVIKPEMVTKTTEKTIRIKDEEIFKYI
jgi:D-aminoacyl-tRNA deacylase